MKALILAAGLGTRLKPLTDTRPKALVEIDGVTMLERVIKRLESQGFDDIVINVHHFSEMVRDFVASKNWRARIRISDESKRLMDTGGGIVKASEMLFKKNDDPVLIHNVDIISTAPLAELIAANASGQTSATLLVSSRDSSRKVVFDKEMKLRGWHNLNEDSYRPEDFKKTADMKEFAFSGIYVMSKEGVREMKEIMGNGSFPVMDYFLNKKRKGLISGIVSENLKLLDIGKPATLSQASDMLRMISTD